MNLCIERMYHQRVTAWATPDQFLRAVESYARLPAENLGKIFTCQRRDPVTLGDSLFYTQYQINGVAPKGIWTQQFKLHPTEGLDLQPVYFCEFTTMSPDGEAAVAAGVGRLERALGRAGIEFRMEPLEVSQF